MKKVSSLKNVLKPPSSSSNGDCNGSSTSLNASSSSPLTNGSSSSKANGGGGASPRLKMSRSGSSSSLKSNGGDHKSLTRSILSGVDPTAPKRMLRDVKDRANSIRGTLRKRKEKNVSLMGTVGIIVPVLYIH